MTSKVSWEFPRYCCVAPLCYIETNWTSKKFFAFGRKIAVEVRDGFGLSWDHAISSLIFGVLFLQCSANSEQNFTEHSIMRSSLVFFAGLLAATLCVPSWAAPPVVEAKAIPSALGMFEAMKSGQIEVLYIPIDESRQAKLLIKNKTKVPLSLKLPANFGATPILAQGGLGGLGGGGQQGGQGQNQQAGGGLGGGGLGGGGQQGGGGAGLFNIAAEKVGELKVATVCLEHGKLEPSKHIPYEVVPLDQCTSKPGVAETLALLLAGKTNQKVAQAAVWHLANGLTWEQLAAKKVNRVGRADTAYYEAAELQAAVELTKHVEKLAKDNAKKSEKTVGSE